MPDIYDMIAMVERVVKIDYTNAPLTIENPNKFYLWDAQDLNNEITYKLKMYVLDLTRDVVNDVVIDIIVNINMPINTNTKMRTLTTANIKQSVLNSFK